MRLRPLAEIPEIAPGAGLPAMFAARAAAGEILAGDVLVIAHKIVSKSEGRVVVLADVVPGALARRLAVETGKDPRLAEVILSETSRIIRQRGGTVICETRHGLVCANAGVDASNVPDGQVILLPVDPDRSARHIQSAVADAAGGRVGVVITDTHGRAFRRGIVNIAIGVAGFRAIVDQRGLQDREGRVLVATEQALADELAAAAGVLMDKAGGHPAIVVRGVETQWGPGTAAELIRDRAHDLFRSSEQAA